MSGAHYRKRMQPEGFTSAEPAPTAEELRRFYAELYYQAPQTSTYQAQYDELDLQYKSLKCRSLLHAFGQLGVSRGTFLDIGAGEGFLLAAARRAGYDVTGLDFSGFGVTKFNPEIAGALIAGDVHDEMARLGADGRRFDVCSTINVLEHVIDPGDFLSCVERVMHPQGLLAITVPNDYSELQRLLLRESYIDTEFWFAPPQHLHYFNTDNLPAYLGARGFEMVDAFSDFPIDLYLLHPGSNYAKDPGAGKSAHRARMTADVLLARRGLDAYLDFYRGMFKVGLGRDITIIVRKSSR